MTHRSIAILLPMCATVLNRLVGYLSESWPSLPAMACVDILSIEWLVVCSLIIGLLALAGYGLWLRRRQSLVVKSDVLHSIVHEFQTPITAIRMAVDILGSPIAHNQPERTKKYVRIIQEETERLQHQVETMLTLARAERDALTLNLEPVEVSHLLQSVAERHGDYLTIRLHDEHAHILADRLHLTNVLYNLIDNAIKYSSGQPRIMIQTRTDDNGLSIAVRDKGVGIPAKAITQIFQPFFRIDDHNQPSIKGFGLGLSYVQRIIQSHKWTIWVKSEPSKGSEFIIQIPPQSILPNSSSQHPDRADCLNR